VKPGTAGAGRGRRAAAVTEPVFLRDGERFVPTGHARGPWDAETLHGGAPAALVAEALQRAAPADGMAVFA
jgi:hypothetical protein